uniref:Ectopic P granules protein 5 homolog n=1 Tax=Cacopsylla melanoneura TaxID=428564 RepID=A0A8D8XCV4_9HEMI
MEGKNPEVPKTNYIQIPGSSTHRDVIEHSYKRSECVENVEKALYDAFNEIHSSSSYTEPYMKSLEHLDQMSREMPVHELLGRGESSTNMETSCQEISAMNIREIPKIDSTNEPTVLPADKTPESNEQSETIAIESDVEIQSSKNTIHNPVDNETLTTDDIVCVQQSTANEMNPLEQTNPNTESKSVDVPQSSQSGSKMDMRLKLSNSNEYLQLIFSPSPPTESESNQNNTRIDISADQNTEQSNVQLEINNSSSSSNNREMTSFTDNIEDSTSIVTSSSFNDNTQTEVDNIDEHLKHFSLENNESETFDIKKMSRLCSESSLPDDDDIDFSLENEDPYELISIKELAMKKRNKQRLLSTTSVDSFSETLNDYVIPSLPSEFMLSPEIEDLRNDAPRNGVEAGMKDTLRNAVEDIEEGVDCTDAGEEDKKQQKVSLSSIELNTGPNTMPTDCSESPSTRVNPFPPSVPENTEQDINPFAPSVPENISTDINLFAPHVPENLVPFEGAMNSSAPPRVPVDIPCETRINPFVPSVPEGTSECGGHRFDVTQNETNLQPMTEEQLASLYRNRQLDLIPEFKDGFFSSELNSGFVLKHPLYDLITGYLNAKKQVTINAIQLEAFKADVKDFESKVWTLETSVVNENAECQDGNPVSASHRYKVSKYDENVYTRLCRTLSCIQDLVTETFTNNMYLCQLDKLKIEDFLAALRESFSSVVPHNAPVALYEPSQLSPELHTAVSQLRAAISVLFAFQRRFISDEEFLSQSREWLEKLVQILLRVATWRDHLFLLSHVLRCPSGTHSWAVQFIQCPLPPHNTLYSAAHVDHMLTLLATMTSPVEHRDTFLNANNAAAADSNEHWVMINSDDEDDDDVLDASSYSTLKEMDMIALLNQIPVESLVKQLLRMRHDGNVVLEEISTSSCLVLLAQCNHLVDILYNAIRTYSKHKQLTKRLGLLYIHIAEYLTDYLGLLLSQNSSLAFSQQLTHQNSSLDLSQVLIEYNQLILRCVRNLTQLNSTTWFFLPQVPFRLISLNSSWTILNYLLRQVDGAHKFSLSDDTVDYLASLDDELGIYLMNTVSNLMTGKNMDLVYTVVQYLLHIGYFEPKLYAKYQKLCENLLVNALNEDSHLITFVVSEVNNNVERIHNENGKLLLYLFNYVNIFQYTPNESDITVMSEWLNKLSITNKLNNLARFILSKFNYNELSHEIQVNIALVVASAWLKHTPDVSTNISVSVSLLTDSMSYLIKPINNEQIFNQWCWQIVYKLRLHLFDLPDSQMIRLHLNNMDAYLQSLPDLDTAKSGDSQMLLLSNAMSTNQCLPCYITLLVTNIGHSLPLLNERAWHILNILIQYYRYSAVINVLQYILPLFVHNRDLLVNNYTFLNIVISLLNADRTYTKVVKNIIFSQFPGPVLKNLSNIIHYQLSNFHLYGLDSCHVLIILWTEILCSVYKQDDQAVSYLLDTVLQYCVYDEPLRYQMKEILIRLIQTLPCKQSNTGISSLVSWVSSTNNIIMNHTLLVKPLSSYGSLEYFTLVNLEIEEYLLQNKTNLWTTLLAELNNASGKTNIDASLKKVCSSLKMNTLTSSHLPLYRYLYFILELPISSSTLAALFVQKFFSLYLTRVNGVCVGHKFFEGISNNNLSKRLKGKLKEFVSHYDTRHAELTGQDPDSVAEESPSMPLDDRIAFYSRLRELFNSYVLWLDEPRLLEPCLYLPALPPAYDPNRLAVLIQNTTPTAGGMVYWYEYVNYSELKTSQLSAMSELSATQNRALGKKVHRVSSGATGANAGKDGTNYRERIVKRLSTCESGKKLKKFSNKDNKLSTSVNKELIINKDIMLGTLKTNFNNIIEYSEVYRLGILENVALNEQYKSSLRVLYNDVRSEVVLNAACDVETAGSNNSYLNCAGPAVIRIQITESKLNVSVQHILTQNRQEFDCLLKRLMLPPPHTIALSTIYVHNFINTLVNEYNQVKQIGDYKLIDRIRQTSICLFYEFVQIYTRHEYIYLPIVHIFNQYVDSLGQVFIRDTENECYHVLQLILNHHTQLYELLFKHFTPLHSTPSKYIEMYDLLVSINSLNVNKLPSIVVYNLLNKFNVNVWLARAKPKLSERTRMINLIVNALSNAPAQGAGDSTGPTAQAADSSVPEKHGLDVTICYRKHLIYMMAYEFPEHYGEILNSLLKFSETESVQCAVWYDFLNVLLYGEAAVDHVIQGGADSSKQFARPGLPISILRDITQRYAVDQHALSLYELQGTATLLGSHFTKERLQYGLYGLYPKYKTYVEVIGIFLGMISHALIVQTLYHCKGLVADKLSSQICPVLISLYSPWILPYLTSQLIEPTASWIQQLTDDRSILHPWVEADNADAARLVHGFVESVKFMIDMLPASTNIYSFVWQFYTANFTHSTLREHILCVVHSHLIHLAWVKFLPSLTDLELMLKLVDQYLPACHTFLSQVFIQIQWNNVIQKYHQSDSTSSKIHCTLLHLLIKLANEPSIRQSNKITPLLLEAQSFAWHLLDAQWYEQVTNWFVMSYEPHVMLQSSCAANVSVGVDLAALDLLQVAAGYTVAPTGAHAYHPSTSRKRQIFVRACVRMTLQLATRYKNIVQSQPADVKKSITSMIDKVDTIISSSVLEHLRVYESSLLLSELLLLLNQSASSLGNISLEAFCDWLSSSTNRRSIVLCGILKVSGAVVKNDAALSQLLETCVRVWFQQTPVLPTAALGDQDCSEQQQQQQDESPGSDWSRLLTLFQKVPPKSPPFEDSLLSHNCLLTLYIMLVKNLPASSPGPAAGTLPGTDLSQNAAVLSKLISYVGQITPNEGLDESKLPLLWMLYVQLIHTGCQEGNAPVQSLNILLSHLNGFISYKPSWQLLSAIGLKKQTIVSNKCRLLCKSLVSFILTQLPERIEGEPESPTMSSQYIRQQSGAPGHLTSNSSDLVPSPEALKSVSQLEQLASDKNYNDLKPQLELALQCIRDPNYSMANCHHFVIKLAKRLYSEGYIQSICNQTSQENVQ